MTASEVILTYWSWPLFLKVQGTSQAHNHIISNSKSTELQSSCLIKTKLRKISQDMLLVDDRHPPSDIIIRTWGGVELITTLAMNRIILISQAMWLTQATFVNLVFHTSCWDASFAITGFLHPPRVVRKLLFKFHLYHDNN